MVFSLHCIQPFYQGVARGATVKSGTVLPSLMYNSMQQNCLVSATKQPDGEDLWNI